jgi:hypothetical protein
MTGHKWETVHVGWAGVGIRVLCYVCAQPTQLSKVHVDRNGPAFKAYYCELCYAKACIIRHNPRTQS